MEKISVFLSDWQVLFREGIHFTLAGEEDFEVIGEATTNEEALNLIEKNPPKVAIFNANMGKPSGIEITCRIKRNLLPVAIILVMDRYSDEQLFPAVKSGANACLTKEASPSELIDIIRKVVQGEYPIIESLLKPEIATRVVDEFEAFSTINKEIGNLLARLLPTETDILHHIASGNPIEELTKTLGLKEEAIRYHLNLILAKLVVNNRSREIFEIAQSNLSSIISKLIKVTDQGSPTEYITKDEFFSFKEHLKALISELGKI